ncbi:MAG: outer membrane beta-barrel protein [Hydrogenophilaceae bacterium]|nr:outer membrane beta-barrel protein [Hydrogenophilaceae bacterium]
MKVKTSAHRPWLTLLMTALLAQMAWLPASQAADAPAAPAAQAQQGEAEAAGTTTGGIPPAPSVGGGGLFDVSTGSGQQAFTPGYEASGIGGGFGGEVVGVGMTAPVRGAPIVSGGVFIYPGLGLSLGNNDNVTGASANEIDSTFYSLRPQVVAEVKTRGDRYTASYAGNFTRYQDSSNDDFDHNDLQLAGDNVFTSRAALGWGIGYIQRTDPRGATDRPTSTSPDKWHSPIARALFAYGAKGATGRIEVEASLQDKTYDNNRTYTRSSDVELRNLAGRFFYRVAPKTSALVEVRDTEADYKLSTSTQDNNERRYYVGATWEATAATTGIVKVGRLEKKYDAAGVQDFSGSSWEGTIRWQPLTYTAFDLTTSKSTSDSTDTASYDYIVNKNISLAWNHMWSSYLGTRVNVGRLKSDFAASTRSDETTSYGFAVMYQWRRWLQVGLDWSHTKRDSNDNANDFTRNVTMLTLEGTL